MLGNDQIKALDAEEAGFQEESRQALICKQRREHVAGCRILAPA
jgi:hypothetical protein